MTCGSNAIVYGDFLSCEGGGGNLHFANANLSHNNFKMHAGLQKYTIYLSESTRSSNSDG